MNKKKTFYIVHGYGANGFDNFFVWLKNEIELNTDSECINFNLPNTNFPNPKQQINYLNQNVKNLNHNTYFVGHSLGCVVILLYLNQLASAKKIGGVFLVSGFVHPLPLFPNLNNFVNMQIDFQKIKKVINNKYVIASKDDNYVPFKFSQLLAKAIAANFILLNNYGHFLVAKVPELMQLIKNVVYK